MEHFGYLEQLFDYRPIEKEDPDNR